MIFKNIEYVFVLFLVLSQDLQVQGIWFPWYFYRYASEQAETSKSAAPPPPHPLPATHGTYDPGTPKQKIQCPAGMRPKNHTLITKVCDDNPVLMQLARLYVVSPERIVLLLSEPSLQKACANVNEVVDRIDGYTRDCRMANDNIYRKLTQGLAYFKTEICDGGDRSSRKRSARLNSAHDCIRELRSDLIECEAPADWYERRNASRVCKTFNDIINCYYTRAAMLCGLDAARQLRSFAGDSMQRSLIHDCPISSRLPRVDDPMPAKETHLISPPLQYLQEDEKILS